MKKVFVMIVMAFCFCMAGTNAKNSSVTVNTPAKADYFCRGWVDGYENGYCYGMGYGCINPVVPICPIPGIGEDNYKGGYNRGFLQGLRDQK